MRLALLVATERGAQERGGRAYTLRVHVLTAFQRPPIYLPPSPGAPRSPRPNDRGCWPRARTTRLRTTRSDTTTTSNTRPTSLSSRAPGKAFGRLLFHIHVYIIARSFKASTYPRLSPSLPIPRPCLTCRRHRLYHRLRKQSPRPTKPSWRVSAYRLPRIRASRVAPRESKPKKKFINNLSFLRFCIICIFVEMRSLPPATCPKTKPPGTKWESRGPRSATCRSSKTRRRAKSSETRPRDERGKNGGVELAHSPSPSGSGGGKRKDYLLVLLGGGSLVRVFTSFGRHLFVNQ